MAYQIEIADQDISLTCEAGESVLEAIERAGYAVPYSCRKGVCATCECALTSGSVAVGSREPQASPLPNLRVCVAVPRSDICIAPSSIRKAALLHRKRISVSVYRIEHPAEDVTVLQLRLPIGRRMPFRAGQYIRVHFGDGESRNYSLANAPRDNNQMVLHIRHVPAGRFSGGQLPHLQVGDLLDVEGPFGQFGANEESASPILMLATGTGYAPLNSILADNARRRKRRPVHLFWGGRTSRDLYQMELLESLAQQENWFRFTPVLSAPDVGWHGASGHVQHAALHSYLGLLQAEVLACGSPEMIHDAKSLLCREGGLPEGAFFSDAFVPSGNDAEM